MKPPSQKLFKAEEYQDAPAWFLRFLQYLNKFSEPTVNTLNKNVSLDDNLATARGSFTIIPRATATENTQQIALVTNRPVVWVFASSYMFDDPTTPVMDFKYFAVVQGTALNLNAMSWETDFIGKKMVVNYLVYFK